MGMYDYIQVDTALSQLPQVLLNAWGKQGVMFQTKDTPNQAMSTYKIDDGRLWVEKTEGHWEEGKECDEDAPFSEKIASFGRMVIDKRWWEPEDFTGNIRFYESYSHPEYYELDDHAGNSDDWMRFVRGWIEYGALFKNGKLLGDIELVEHAEPQKLSDEELADSKEKAAVQREEMEANFKEHRVKWPSPEQKLVDNIDRECKLAETIMDENDLSNALSNIRFLIKEYRKNYDRWYTN